MMYLICAKYLNITSSIGFVGIMRYCIILHCCIEPTMYSIRWQKLGRFLVQFIRMLQAVATYRYVQW